MKQLTQAVFDLPECPDSAITAVVNSKGNLIVLKCRLDEVLPARKSWVTSINTQYQVIDSGYDTTNWQNSAISRD